MATELPVSRKTGSRRQPLAGGLDLAEAEGRRRTEERRSLDTLEFIKAIDRFKRKKQKVFLSWSEVLDILRSLGYRKDDD